MMPRLAHRGVGLEPSEPAPLAGVVIRTFVVVVLLAGLNVLPLNSAWGIGLAGLAALIAPFDAVAFCAFVAGSQVVADPVGSPLTVMQLGFVGWALSAPFTGWLRGVHGAKSLLRRTAPLLLWTVAIQTINGTLQLLAVDLALGIAVGAIVAGYASVPNARPSRMLGGLVAGASLACMGYVGMRLGLPIAVVETMDSVRGITRIGVGRGDVNNAGLNLPLAFCGLAALVFRHAVSKPRGASVLGGAIAMVGAAALLVPAAFATGSRTSLYQMVGGVLLLAVIALRMAGRSASARRTLVVAAVGTLVTTGLLMATPAGDDAADYFTAILRANSEQASSNRAAQSIAGRVNAWSTHVAILKEYPLAGIPSGTTWDFGEFGVAEVGRSGTFGRAHNTALEFASLAGIPAMLLFLHAILMPAWRHRGLMRDTDTQPIFATYCVALLGLLGLSLPGWKCLWALMALLHESARRSSPLR